VPQSLPRLARNLAGAALTVLVPGAPAHACDGGHLDGVLAIAKQIEAIRAFPAKRGSRPDRERVTRQACGRVA
jgi:hypothetical protein